MSWINLETGGAYAAHKKVPAEALVCPVCGKAKGLPIHGECAKYRKPFISSQGKCVHAADLPVDPKAIYLTLREVAAMAGCSPSSVRDAVYTGTLAAIRGRGFRPDQRHRGGYQLYVVHPDAARAWVDAWVGAHK